MWIYFPFLSYSKERSHPQSATIDKDGKLSLGCFITSSFFVIIFSIFTHLCLS